MTNKFRLNIYTYTPLSGADAGLVVTEHESVGEAVAALDSYTQPYAYAYLSRYLQFDACWHLMNFDGKAPVGEVERRYGVNRNVEHPALSAMKVEWDQMAIEVAKRHKDEGRGLVHIAGEILKDRHPSVTGMAEKLAEAAYAI